MANYINGVLNPRFKIYDSNNNFIEEIDLNLCDEDGLTEEYELFNIEHLLLNYTLEKRFEGYRITFTLSYKNFSDKENTLNIQKLIIHILSNNTIVLVPRIDDLSRQFEVVYSGDSFQLNVFKGKYKSIGNRGIELVFKTKNKLTDFNWTDPDNLPYFSLDDYAFTN